MAGFGVGVLATLVQLSCARAESRPQKPNVIIAFSDQHRWQAMSFTETPKVFTPEMRRMAEEGFSADNFVSNYPLCSPARAALLTGRWPQQTGVIDNSSKSYSALSPKELTLGKVFENEGYDTAYVGKWHLGGETASLQAFGFQHSIVWSRTNNHWKSSYAGPDGKKKVSTRYNGNHMTDQLLEFISQPRDNPFFAVVSWNLPHSNYIDAPVELRVMYSDEGAMPYRENWALPPDVDVKEVGGTHYRGYHAHVTAVDSELGRIRTRLEELGKSEDTLVLYLSDHGAMLRSHGRFGKRVPYAESIKVPFLAVWPGVIPSAGTSASPHGLIDVMPTLCSLAGIPIPEQAVGVDFSGAILGRDSAEPGSQFLMNIAAEHPRQMDEPGPPAEFYRGVTSGQYTYAVTAEKPWLLFDNQADPLQMRNLVDDPEYAEVKERLHGLLGEWLKKAKDSFPLPGSSAASSASAHMTSELR